MRRRKVSGGLERQFLIGLVVSKPFLASAAPVLDTDLLQSSPLRLIAKWCLDYWTKYSEAPGKNIEAVFHKWVDTEERDEDEVDAVSALLEGLSKEHDSAPTLNVPHLLDELGKYLSLQKLTKLNEALDTHLATGDQDEALRQVIQFSSVDLGLGAGINPMMDRAAWERAFAAPAEPLIEFPGDAGRFLNHALTRDALVGIQAPEKRGKTFWCVEFVIRALRARRKVALFEVGDLSESQIMRRLGVRLSAAPMYRDQCGVIQVPDGMERVNAEEGEVPVELSYKQHKAPHVVTRRSSLRAVRKFMRGCGLDRRTPHLMLSVHANSSINVKGIEGLIERWEHERGFVPDVVVIDYPDILLPEDTKKEFRHQVNDTWKALRRMSQERHCLVIAPTQANTMSYDVDTQTMKHFSEDKRKGAHVTAMLGLNQTPAEKKVGVMRLNWILLREADFNVQRCLCVGQCLALGRAFCCGRLL